MGLVQHLRENRKTLSGIHSSPFSPSEAHAEFTAAACRIVGLTTAFHNELIAPRDILLLVATYQCWRAWAP